MKTKHFLNYNSDYEKLNYKSGSQYTSLEWTKCLDEWGIQISMDGKGRATDNAFVERLFRSVKQEHVYLHSPENGQELFKGLKNWFNYETFEKFIWQSNSRPEKFYVPE